MPDDREPPSIVGDGHAVAVVHLRDLAQVRLTTLRARRAA
jgi:hypothetical protein